VRTTARDLPECGLQLLQYLLIPRAAGIGPACATRIRRAA
jgi:hypothetical protein